MVVGGVQNFFRVLAPHHVVFCVNVYSIVLKGESNASSMNDKLDNGLYTGIYTLCMRSQLWATKPSILIVMNPCQVVVRWRVRVPFFP